MFSYLQQVSNFGLPTEKLEPDLTPDANSIQFTAYFQVCSDPAINPDTVPGPETVSTTLTSENVTTPGALTLIRDFTLNTTDTALDEVSARDKAFLQTTNDHGGECLSVA